ncbi:MAG: hypothetical protein JW771_02620 [Candidatus Thermoplasmatota archaeon]|nr:hypothetical protein [Candidatus Thermoplasmatota archaeon]
MASDMLQQMSKKTWYRWSFYINIVLFFIIALCIYLLVIDCLSLHLSADPYAWLYITRDLAFLSIALALIFFQFFRNLLLIMRRAL